VSLLAAVFFSFSFLWSSGTWLGNIDTQDRHLKRREDVSNTLCCCCFWLFYRVSWAGGSHTTNCYACMANLDVGVLFTLCSHVYGHFWVSVLLLQWNMMKHGVGLLFLGLFGLGDYDAWHFKDIHNTHILSYTLHPLLFLTLGALVAFV